MDFDTGHIEFSTGPEYAYLAAEMHRQCFDQPWDDASFHSALTIPGTLFELLSIDRNPIAFALYRQMQDEAEILTISVLPAYRGHGHGQRLLAAGIGHLGRNGVRSLFLEVSEGNPAAVALYKRAGFRQIGRRKAYYEVEGGRQDALILKLSDIGGTDEDKKIREI